MSQQISRVSQPCQAPPAARAQDRRPQGGASFQDFLLQAAAQQAAPAAESVAFSKHALARTEERGIQVTPDLMERLSDIVERAEAKGITNILAFNTSSAFIINVPHAKVITAISQGEMRENMFTNIDGAAVL